jgi:serine/threonine protein kinase
LVEIVTSAGAAQGLSFSSAAD